MKQRIVVLAEIAAGEAAPSTFELLALAARLEEWGCGETLVLVFGRDPEAAARDIASRTGTNVLGLAHPALDLYNNEIAVRAVLGALEGMESGLVLVAHTSLGLDLAPLLAVGLDAACLAGVKGVSRREGQLVFSRGIFGGKITADLISTSARSVALIEPGAFKDLPVPQGSGGAVEIHPLEGEPHHVRALGINESRAAGGAVTEADVIVAGGRGLGRVENLSLLEKVASFFPRSVVAGSRPVCDAGWLDYRRQIGLTGATVSPKLYLACGISGARQHTVGMQTADFIAAVSLDPDAAIFNLSDVVIVEDLENFLPELIEVLAEYKPG